MAKKTKTAKENDVICRDAHTPRQLGLAVAALHLMDDNEIIDSLANDTANSYRLLMAAVVDCRECLDEIEAFARKQLGNEVAYHRQYLNEIEALNVLPKMRAVA